MKAVRTLFIGMTMVTTLLVLVATAGAMEHSSSTNHGSMDMNHGSMDMNHGSMDMDHGKMDMNHGQMNMEHGSMSMQGGMIMLGNETENGVEAMAHLKDVREAMSKVGMTGTTHHLMLKFKDQATGKPIDSGTVAVKIQGPDGKEMPPVKLMGMMGHFGADVDLETPGTYHFTVGTKLADGTKRQYEFSYTLK